MSDPVTNVEIEDVLASIRRLVSEDVRVRPMVPAAAPAPSVAPGADRLVLTPALRVMETAEEAEAASAPEETDTAVWDNPEARLADVWPEDQPIPAAPEPASPEQEAAEGVEEAPFLHVEMLPDAEVHQLLNAGEPAQPEQDVSEEASPAQDMDLAEAPPPVAVLEAIYQVEAEAPAESLAEDIAPPNDEATLEWEDHDEFGPEPHEGEDHLEPIEPEMAEEPARSELYAASTEAHDADDGIEDILADEAVIDEAALREMVAEIVRQELMGALGERITRNVRKLVRREIHRALSAQDFE